MHAPSSDAEPAKIFIICGRERDTDEVAVAGEIAARLTDLGFDPYIAMREQTPRGLKGNIFSQLEASEYFIFIDFRRERLADGPSGLHRGSLFSNQELALAAFLDMPLLALQEQGVKPEDGVWARKSNEPFGVSGS